MPRENHTFSEKRARNYLANDELVIQARTIPKRDGLALRRISGIMSDNRLRQIRAVEPEKPFHTRRYHRRQLRHMHEQTHTICEHAVHTNAYGCGPDRTHREAALIMREAIQSGARYIFRGDFREFFPSIDLAQLEDLLRIHLPDKPQLRAALLRIQTLRQWDDDEYEIVRPVNGVSQGLSPATLLANLYLASLDAYCSGSAPYYARVVDDFIVPFNTYAEAQRFEHGLRRFLAQSYPTLTLHPEKTRIVPADEIEFVGYTVKADTLELTLSPYRQSIFREHFRDLTAEWHRHRDIKQFKREFKMQLDAARLQLSVVSDPVMVTELWHFLNFCVCHAFNELYPTFLEKRKALRKLQIRMGVSQALLNGAIAIERAAPFSINKLQEVLYHGLPHYQIEGGN